MDEEFDLPVTYNGAELELKARLLTQGYTHKIIVEVNGEEISFEPDEERNYRAVMADADNIGATDSNFLKAIAQTIEGIFKN